MNGGGAVLAQVLASGAVAAASRHSIGTGIIGGMVGATALALFFAPLFYYLIARLRESKSSRSISSAESTDWQGGPASR